MGQQVETAGRGRRQLIMMITLFLVPPIAAWLAWQYLGEHGVGVTTNNGTLVSPARPLTIQGLTGPDGSPLSLSELRGRWLYVVYGNNGCPEACQQQLYVTRQARIAVNKDIPRVRRLLVLDDSPDRALASKLAEEHEDLVIAIGMPEALRSEFRGETFNTDGGQFFLVDPLGNLMFYPSDAVPRGVLRDLQKLLKISQVG